MLFQPVGCIISGFLQQFIGRKTGMLLMNIPELIAWILMYTANSPKMLFISVIMMGLSAGFMEAPGLSYIGEISQPRIRGVLTSFANINISVGMLFAFFLGSVFDWRTTVAISAIVPIITIAMIAFVSYFSFKNISIKSISLSLLNKIIAFASIIIFIRFQKF